MSAYVEMVTHVSRMRDIQKELDEIRFDLSRIGGDEEASAFKALDLRRDALRSRLADMQEEVHELGVTMSLLGPESVAILAFKLPERIAEGSDAFLSARHELLSEMKSTLGK